MKFKFINTFSNITLLDFLKKHHFSKRLIPKIKYSVIVNQKHENLDFELKMNDLVEIEVKPTTQFIQPIENKLSIVYEDDYLIILNKPSGLNTIPSISEYGLLNFVRAYVLKESLHVVTRLDKDTTGLVLIVKNPYIHALFEHQLINQNLIKKYYALTKNKLEGSIIELPISKSEDGIKRKVDLNGSYAKTEFQLLQNGNDLFLYEVILHTGKTHQIRVHFSHYGAPLIGDVLYHGDTSNFSRQALHCGYLKFVHPITQQTMEFKLDLPQDLKNYILKNS